MVLFRWTVRIPKTLSLLLLDGPLITLLGSTARLKQTAFTPHHLSLTHSLSLSLSRSLSLSLSLSPSLLLSLLFSVHLLPSFSLPLSCFICLSLSSLSFSLSLVFSLFISPPSSLSIICFSLSLPLTLCFSLPLSTSLCLSHPISSALPPLSISFSSFSLSLSPPLSVSRLSPSNPSRHSMRCFFLYLCIYSTIYLSIYVFYLCGYYLPPPPAVTLHIFPCEPSHRLTQT